MSEDNNNPVCKLVMDKLQQITPTVQSLMPDGSKTRHSFLGAWTTATRCSTE